MQFCHRCDRYIILVKEHIFSSFVAVFWRFLLSKTPILLYRIRYWWFFLYQDNRWTKYRAHPKIPKLKPYLLMFASLITLYSFQRLLTTQLTADLTAEWSGGSRFHPLSHIYAYFVALKQLQTTFWIAKSLLFWLTVSKRNNTRFEYSFSIDKCSCKMVHTLPSDISNSSVMSRNFNLRSAKTNLWIFFF